MLFHVGIVQHGMSGIYNLSTHCIQYSAAAWSLEAGASDARTHANGVISRWRFGMSSDGEKQVRMLHRTRTRTIEGTDGRTDGWTTGRAAAKNGR